MRQAGGSTLYPGVQHGRHHIKSGQAGGACSGQREPQGAMVVPGPLPEPTATHPNPSPPVGQHRAPEEGQHRNAHHGCNCTYSPPAMMAGHATGSTGSCRRVQAGRAVWLPCPCPNACRTRQAHRRRCWATGGTKAPQQTLPMQHYPTTAPSHPCAHQRRYMPPQSGYTPTHTPLTSAGTCRPRVGTRLRAAARAAPT